MSLSNICVDKWHPRWELAGGVKNAYFVNSTNKNSYAYRNEDCWLIICSYDTRVLAVDTDGQMHRLWNGWSLTTQTHINAYLDHFYNGKLHVTVKDWGWMNVECASVNTFPRADFSITSN